jgi:hypothetical protein
MVVVVTLSADKSKTENLVKIDAFKKKRKNA